MSEAIPIGHIKLARKAFDTDHGDEFWLEPREFSRFEAWVDVIQLACFAPYRYQTGFGEVDLNRGEFVASLRWLGARWKWTVKRVRNWIATCQKRARITAQRETPAGTVYLIVNYDTYQAMGHSRGTPTTTGKGTAGAQQGHKREAIQAIQAITTLSDSPEDQVLAHYLTRHPKRRPGEKAHTLIRRALVLGYTPAELCEAIDGNADDDWHTKTGKQGLDYVLRTSSMIDDFRARYDASKPKQVVDPATGLPNAAGLAIIAGMR